MKKIQKIIDLTKEVKKIEAIDSNESQTSLMQRVISSLNDDGWYIFQYFSPYEVFIEKELK